MDGMDWIKLSEVISHKAERLPAPAQFRLFASLLLDAPYAWGEENPGGTDCSGTIAFPLLMMGYNVRLTADGFMREIFTADAPNLSDLGQIAAVFYVTRRRKEHGSRIVPAGTAVHVTPVMGQNVILNAQGGKLARLQPPGVAADEYARRGCDTIWRRIDPVALRNAHTSGRAAWGVDPIVALLTGR